MICMIALSKQKAFNTCSIFMKECVTFSLFKFDRTATKWWAFVQMGLGVKNLLKEVEGLKFCKLVGSGGGNGFSIYPNFAVYGLMCVWENEENSEVFFEKNPFFQAYKIKTEEIWTVWLKTTMSHGIWDKAEPFAVSEKFDDTLPVAVLTRATIKLRYLPYFWKFVPRTSRSVFDVEGRIFSIGIGELPIIQQATFSLWQDAKKMMAFAYKSQFHSEVVQKTRALGWYSEELFARFYPYKESGTWDGKQILKDNFGLGN